ncbi:MAG: histidine kinase [Bacteroides sp.]|nr:histidine kinase [Bacteroides sp.]
MKHRKFIFLFILTISISLFVFGAIYNVIGGKPWQDNFTSQYFLNFPLCVALGFIDLGIINAIYKRLKHRNNVIRILADMLLTTFLSILITFFLNRLLLLDSNISSWPIFRNSLPVIPLNWIIVLQIEIFLYSLQQTEIEKRLVLIEKEKALYQFEVLKNQINPHFLFNSLNVLASLAYQDPAKTNLFAKKLSTVYRYLLTTHGRSQVTLQEELSFVKSYLYLEEIRFGDTLHVEITDHPKNDHRSVIPASIQMLVENAIKHNISTQKSPLTIHIIVNDDGIIVSNNLQLRNYVAQNGTGLQNLKHQYALYNKHIEIIRNETEFTVKIPFL